MSATGLQLAVAVLIALVVGVVVMVLLGTRVVAAT
jgi:hypothetical protein